MLPFDDVIMNSLFDVVNYKQQDALFDNIYIANLQRTTKHRIVCLTRTFMEIGAVIDICGVWVVIKIKHNQRTHTAAIKLLKYA